LRLAVKGLSGGLTLVLKTLVGGDGSWHWTIYPEAGPDVISEAKYRSREAAVAACIEEINNGIERSRHARRL
jgi:hypothetical protein